MSTNALLAINKEAMNISQQPTHHMIPIAETAFIGLSLISLTASRLMLADAANPQQFALQWFLLPLVGALCSSVCAMLMNPTKESSKTVTARCIFGVVCGTAIPKVVSMFHPALKELSLDPALTFLSGFSVCMVAYVVSRPFVEKLYSRSSDIANVLEGHVENRISEVLPHNKPENTNSQTTPQP